MPKGLHLAYHDVRQEGALGLNCTPQRFRVELIWLRGNGYVVLTCGEVAECISRKCPLPERYATLSFDDGLASQFTTALPILEEFGLRATFFVITCSLFGELPPVFGIQLLVSKLGEARMEQILRERLPAPYNDLMDPQRYDITGYKLGERPERRRIYQVFAHVLPHALQRDLIAEWFAEFIADGMMEAYVREICMKPEELRVMVRRGMEVASHSVSHPLMSALGTHEVETEALESKRHLEELLGQTVQSFAWPYGGVITSQIREIISRPYASAWNYRNAEAMPPEPHDLWDMPRLNEAKAFSATWG